MSAFDPKRTLALPVHKAVIAIPEIMIVLIVLGCVAWVIWAVREHKQATQIAALSQAWRDILADPHYMERRHFEERKRVEQDEQKRTAGSLG
jgi:predicted negative regulator of RcsB-dependent stress response